MKNTMIALALALAIGCSAINAQAPAPGPGPAPLEPLPTLSTEGPSVGAAAGPTEAAASCETIAEVMEDPEVSTFAAYVQVGNLTTYTSRLTANNTLLIPTNDGLNAATESGEIDVANLGSDPTQLQSLALGYIIPGHYSYDDLQDGQTLRALSGVTYTVSKQDDSATLTSGDKSATITSFRPSCTAMVAFIDSVMGVGTAAAPSTN